MVFVRTGEKVASSDSDEYSDDSLSESPEKRERVTQRLAELALQWEAEHSINACTTTIVTSSSGSSVNEEKVLIRELRFLQSQLESLTQIIQDEDLKEGIDKTFSQENEKRKNYFFITFYPKLLAYLRKHAHSKRLVNLIHSHFI